MVANNRQRDSEPKAEPWEPGGASTAEPCPSGTGPVSAEVGVSSAREPISDFARGQSREAESQVIERAPKHLFLRDTVLVVDDDPMLRKVCGDLLRRIGVNVLTAVDGVEALEIYGDNAERIACVLLDMTMPKMDGPTTLNRLRERGCDVRVVLCSGYNDGGFQVDSGDGAVGFLPKPFRFEQLRAVVEAVLPKAPPLS